jgi:hypothetical protein
MKTITNNNELIVRNYINIHFKNSIRFNSIFNNYPDIYNTQILKNKESKNNCLEETIIKPSLVLKTISGIILFFLISISLNLLYWTFFHDFIFIFPYMFILFIILIVYYFSFKKKDYIYSILINKNGIFAQKKSLYWDNILDTYIMEIQEVKLSILI